MRLLCFLLINITLILRAVRMPQPPLRSLALVSLGIFAAHAILSEMVQRENAKTPGGSFGIESEMRRLRDKSLDDKPTMSAGKHAAMDDRDV